MSSPLIKNVFHLIREKVALKKINSILQDFQKSLEWKHTLRAVNTGQRSAPRSFKTDINFL